WRIHIAALIALILVLGVAAAGGTDARTVALATKAQEQKRSTDAGGQDAGVNPQALEAATAGPQQAAAAQSAGAGTQAGAAAMTPGARTAAAEAAARPKTVYDDGANDQEVRMGGSTFTSGPAATYGEQIAVGFAAGVNYV